MTQLTKFNINRKCKNRGIILFFILLAFLPVGLIAGNQVSGFLISEDSTCKVWWAGTTCKIMRDNPVPLKKGKIVLRAAQNEAEGFQLVLSPKITIENITITVSDLSTREGTLIRAENVIIRNVEYVHVTKPSGKLHQAGWYPDPLPLYEKPFRAIAGMNTPLLLTVKVPKGTTPGIYFAKINLKSKSWEASFTAELKVWNFALPVVPSMRSAFGLYSGMIRQYHNLSNETELKQVLDQYYRSFRDYRISPQQFFDLSPIREKVTGA